MEFRQLECFIAVAEELHFGRAAERLCMTQPPLSRQIQLLEQDLGVTLFERNSRQVLLSAAGRHFLRDARHLLEFSARAAATARRTSGGEAGHITLGFTAVASYRLMPSMIMRARKLLAGVEIQLRETVSTDLDRLLLARELDVILARSVPQQAGIESRLIEREPLVLALPAGSPLCEHDAVPLRLLQGQPFVLYSPREGKYFYDRIVGAFGLADVQPDYVQRAGQTHTLLALIRAGLGVGIVPDSARELRFEGVEFRPIGQRNLYADMYLAWHAQHDNPALDAFLQRVVDVDGAPARRQGTAVP
ncbi:LysR family transcriptional regulator [Achromobacter spanius]|uniref:LysR family transcriptional regulator n=1 Tax=Achromobacter spanius TaxID=217203 RepID=A0AA42ITR7_9BURK|nr:LysR family transcriptional regulator [Achromobacter spanius]MDH0735065.1 LysR family transcriptional regulator [Achromobacter spanius]